MKIRVSMICAAFAAVAWAEPIVRYTGAEPFKDGKRVEAVWKNADRMTRFTTAATFDIAIDQSEAQALFDEKNIYISLKGFYDPRALDGADMAAVKKRNRFECFIQPDPAKPHFVQVMIAGNGDLYCGEFIEGVKRKCEYPTGVRYSIEEGKLFWCVNLTLPFTFLKCNAPSGDMPIKLGIMRRNVALAGGRCEESSCTPVIDNYGVPKYWADVTLTRMASDAKIVKGDVKDFRVNYFANSEFDVPGRCWTEIPQGGHVDRVETMAMSGEWIYRTTGGTYRFLMGAPDSFEPNTDYTLMVKARRYGKEGTLRILTMKKLADGRGAEGEYLGGDIALGADFHEYYFPFRTDSHQPTFINFYRLGLAAEDTGVEIAAIKLLKGNVSALELRKISRIGQKLPIAGTEIPMRPNPYGKRRETLRILAFVKGMQEIREPMEICAGLNVGLDVLRATAVDQDIYETDSDLDAVRTRLDEGGYDLYLVGCRAAELIGGEMYAKIEAAVRKGAGFYMTINPVKRHFEGLLKKAELKPLAADHPLRKAYPGGMYRLAQYTKESPDTMSAGLFGKGRVVTTGDAYFRSRMNVLDYGATDFPLADYTDPWLAKVFYWVADREAGKGAASSPCGSATHLGKTITAWRIVDQDGFTLDYEREIRETPATIQVKTITDSVKGDDPFVFEFLAPEKVVWTLEDFSGRILEKGEVDGKGNAASPVRITVPSRALYTNMGLFRAGDFMAGVYARDRDVKRTYDDFTLSIWPMGNNVTLETVREADKRLLEVGFRASLLPIGKSYANTLRGGLALGGGFLGGGDIFCGWPHKDNVRIKGEINTAAAHNVLTNRAQYEAGRTAKYGVTQAVVCDEPNMSMRYCEMEPDEHPENIAEYRVRMERTYQTITEYNRRHKTAHTSFAEIGPARLADARKSGNFAEFTEWRNFNVDRWCEVIKLLADNGKKMDPDLKLALYNSFGQTALSGNDYWKLLTKAGLEFSNEYTSMVYMGRNAIYNFDELYRSFRPDLRVWGFTGYQLSPQQIAFTPWWFAAHRYGGFTWFAVWSWKWNLFDMPSCAWTKDARDLKQTMDDSRLFKGLGKYTLAWDWAPRDVALYYSHESLIVSTLLGKETKSFEIGDEGPLHEYFYSRQGLQYLVESLLYQHDFVAPEQIVHGKLKEGYKALFMPRILALSDAEVAELKAFAARGGKIVADVMPGDYDGLGVKRATNPFAADEITLYGKSFNDVDMAQHAEMLQLLKSSGAKPVLESDGIEKLEGREAVRFTDGVSDLYMILRMTARSKDSEKQTFGFPKKAHTYDVRAAKYLGFTDAVTAAVPLSGVSLFAQFPVKPEEIAIDGGPEIVRRGTDLVFGLTIKPGNPEPGVFVFHVKLFKPDGTSSFLFERNLQAPNGKTECVFRIAHDDPVGTWKLEVTEPLTRIAETKTFRVK
ncbi:MAG: hypothetical protein PHV28_16640 [Kiritimatiellae bacterium]|nr:hypothetical protein [Kiritimatiellia bacterium]